MSSTQAAPIQVAMARPYRVHVGAGLLSDLPAWIDATYPGLRVAVLTDSNVQHLHLACLGRLAEAPRLATSPGEGAKSFACLERVLDFLCTEDLGRDSLLVAFGGGVIGDLGGLAASLYMRGIPIVHCPTTLLAQVDSSIGGKTAINLSGGKNLAGSFHQPEAVFADTNVLATLSDQELRAGLGEVIKTAIVGDPELFELLEANTAALLARDPALLAEVVTRCVQVKGDIVARDERDSGERKQLNLGHTFAHAIEYAAGYGQIPHGEAVATGLQLACDLAQSEGLLQDPALPSRLKTLLLELGLSPSLSSLRQRFGQALETEALISGMLHDKKARAGQPQFVLPWSLGDLAIDCEVSLTRLRAAL